MKYSYLFIMFAVLLGVGCDKEDDIKVTDGLETSYTLPQGNHDYDSEIVNWYEKYGFYTLYIFEGKDIYWANTNWEERLDYNKPGGSLKSEIADPEYVGKQLDLFERSFLNIYPDSLIVRYMPLKVLLCSELWNTWWEVVYDWTAGEMVRTLVYDKIWAYQGWDYIAINGGSQEIDTMGVTSKLEFQSAVNSIFLECLLEAEKLKMPDEFTSISDYTSAYLVGDQVFARGFLTRNPLGGDIEITQRDDFYAFIKLISMPLELLETVPDRRYDYDYSRAMSIVGALHPTRDSEGLVRRKYDVLIKMLKKMGIDTDKLQNPDFE